MSKKLGLNQLKVKSFVTDDSQLNDNTVKAKGGGSSSPFCGQCDITFPISQCDTWEQIRCIC